MRSLYIPVYILQNKVTANVRSGLYLISLALSWRWYAWCDAAPLMYHGLARPGEALAAPLAVFTCAILLMPGAGIVGALCAIASRSRDCVPQAGFEPALRNHESRGLPLPHPAFISLSRIELLTNVYQTYILPLNYRLFNVLKRNLKK